MANHDLKLINPGFLRFVFPWILWQGTRDTKEVFLTFDDGPHKVYTARILEILNDFEIRATFFLTGSRVLHNPDVVSLIGKHGHKIGNHGFNHISMRFRRLEIIQSEINKCGDAVESVTGQRPALFRPPFGNFDFRFRKLLIDLDLTMVMWTLMSYDFINENPENLQRRIESYVMPGSIIVLHDGHRNTARMLKSLPEIIRFLIEDGYNFKIIDP